MDLNGRLEIRSHVFGGEKKRPKYVDTLSWNRPTRKTPTQVSTSSRKPHKQTLETRRRTTTTNFFYHLPLVKKDDDDDATTRLDVRREAHRKKHLPIAGTMRKSAHPQGERANRIRHR